MKSITIHGLGYVGLTAAVHFAKAGWFVNGYDPDEATVLKLSMGRPRAGEFLEYLDVDVSALRFDATASEARACIRPTTSFLEVLEADVHLIAVPSERGDEPDMTIVESVLTKLADQGRETGLSYDVIIESTLSPGTIAGWLEAYGLDGELPAAFKSLSMCPRRDWFADKDKSLATLKRIVGGVTSNCTERAIEVLSSVTPRDLILLTDAATAELTKPLENALLHGMLMLPTELALNMREQNVAAALELATTHWRLPKLYLGPGTGGRCVPRGPQYLQALDGPHSMLSVAQRTDAAIRHAVAEAVIARGCHRVLVMGVAYRPDFRDHGSSPGLAIARHLRDDFRAHVRVTDPMWNLDELSGISGFQATTVHGTFDSDALILVTPHEAFRFGAFERFDWSGVRLVFDCQGAWQAHAEFFAARGIEYARVGSPGWRQ